MSDNKKESSLLKPVPASSITAPRSPAALTLDQAMHLAAQHHARSDFVQAEQLLKKIIQGHPGFPPALHLLGIIAHQFQQTELAIQLVSQAIQGAPQHSLYYANRAEMLRSLGKINEAITDGEKSILLDPNSASAHSNLGIAYFDAKQFDKAEACQKKALSLQPTLPAALNNLGSICKEQGNNEQAIHYYQQVLAIDPNNIQSLNNLGAMLTEVDRLQEAIDALAYAIKLNPRYVEAHCNIGNAFMALNELDKATLAYRQALTLKPDYAQALIGLARVYQEKNRPHEALQHILQALAIDPNKVEAHCLLGTLYNEMGQPEQSEAAYQKAFLLDNTSKIVWLGLGNLLMEKGDMDAAEKSFQKVLTLEKDNLAASMSLAQLKKTKPGDENLFRLKEHAKNISSMPINKAISLNFALGKALEDIGEYEQAFNHFQQGCKLKRSTFVYDVADACKEMQSIMNFFSSETIRHLSGCGDSSELPIFILGMPRSGTTLTEQILASHSAVYGAGELPDLIDMVYDNKGENLENSSTFKRYHVFPEKIKNFSAQDLTAWGTSYVNGLKNRAPTAQHITDKMPANFAFVGLIHCMLPKAKIIHVKRNAIDTCLSGYCRLFNRTQLQSYDLKEMGIYYHQYEKMMKHWHAVLPQNAFYEIQYEDLINDPEKYTRELLAYCGLEWEPACLNFHTTERKVRTASVTQVREPIYRSSIEKWRHYEKQLAPLLKELTNTT